MPLFDFACVECQDRESLPVVGTVKTDVLLRMDQDHEDNYPKCTVCDSVMEKQPSRVNGSFKGRGFHANDYRAPTRGF